MPTLGTVCEDLKQLHSIKSAAYGASWKKHGELVSIFANISRKHDRLEQFQKWGTVVPNETVLDTVADLATYALLYVSWLIEQRPDVYDDEYTYHPSNEREAFAQAMDIALSSYLLDADAPAHTWTADGCMSQLLGAYAMLETLLLKNGMANSYDWSGKKQQYAQLLAIPAMLYLARASDAEYAEWAKQWRSK